MSYPEQGAGYKHKPQWLDQMKRAEGGHTDADDGNPPTQPMSAEQQSGYDKAMASLNEAHGLVDKAKSTSAMDDELRFPLNQGD